MKLIRLTVLLAYEDRIWPDDKTAEDELIGAIMDLADETLAEVCNVYPTTVTVDVPDFDPDDADHDTFDQRAVAWQARAKEEMIRLGWRRPEDDDYEESI